MKAVVYTLGCKVNDVESGSIIRGLEEMGYNVSREIEKADLYIINTCAVTAEAERKSRQTVGKVFKCNPEAKIIICGCASEKSPADFLEKGHTVYAVTGAQRKNKVLEIIKNGFEKDRLGVCIEEEKRYEEMPLPECLKTRNFVKIQDGCNRFCSYCVIPYLRGRSRSRSLESAAAWWHRDSAPVCYKWVTSCVIRVSGSHRRLPRRSRARLRRACLNSK